MIKSLPKFKRGDTFSLACKYKVDDTLTSLDGATINSQIRSSKGALVATLKAVVADQTATPGIFTLIPTDADTSEWPIGVSACDIEIVIENVVRSSESFVVPIVEGVTR